MSPRRPAASPRRLAVASLLFVFSGFAALVYQVAWQRILALHSGIGVYAVAVSVAAFMAGLGIGSHTGGVLSARTTRTTSLFAFAGLEFGIGIFGLLSPVIYYDWLYPIAAPLPSPSLAGTLLHVAALLPPTMAMGMSLPFLVRAIVTDVEHAGRSIGSLYGFNLGGAALGAAAGTWILLPRGGIRGAVAVAALANLIVCLGAAWLARRNDDGAPAAVAPSVSTSGTERPGQRPFALWLALYALSGFTALSLEILWFRIVDVAVKSTAFTFGTVLGLYLLGNTFGCLAAAPLASRIRRPLQVFLTLQCGLLVYSALVVTAIVRLAPDSALLNGLVAYWAQYSFFPLGHRWDAATVVRLYLLFPLALFGPPTVMMGVAFPVLQRAVHDDAATSGRKVGALQAANIAGCTAGSLLVGLWLLRSIGTTGAFRFLLVCGLFFAIVGIREYGSRFALAAAALIATAVVFPGQDALWRRLHGVTGPLMAIVREDATGVAAVTPEPGRGDRRWRLSSNGKGNSWFPYGGGHTVLGAAPAIVRDDPADIAIVGLGSGNTVWASACRRATRSVTVFEISAPQPELLNRLAGVDRLPDLSALLADPRVRVVVADGRKALIAGSARYDVIEADAIWPESAYSGNLYSKEFFAACASRLKPAGVMCTWAPTPGVRATFQDAFAHVLAIGGGDILIGSNDPIRVDPAAWAARLAEVSDYLGDAGTADVSSSLRSARVLAPGDRPGLAPNLDLFPRDEFAAR